MYNEKGRESLSLFSRNNGSGLSIFDSKGKERYDLRLSQDDKWMLTKVSDNDGNKRVFFGIGDDGKPGLIFRDISEKVTWYAPNDLASGTADSR